MVDVSASEEPSVTCYGGGSEVLVQYRFAVGYGRPRVYLTQWACGSRVVQSEWLPWPSAGNVAEIGFRLPGCLFENPSVVRLALLVGPDLRGRQRVWSRVFQTREDPTLESLGEAQTVGA
jgi:hypothetical protein